MGWVGLRLEGKREPSAVLRTVEPTPLLPEIDTSRGQLLAGDNLGILRALVDRFPAAFPLIYLDPPFATGRTFRIGDGRVAYHDHLTGPAYLAELWQRLVLCHALLADHGTLYVHLCPRIAPYVRLLLDELFGVRRYHRSIIWKRAVSHPNAKSLCRDP